MNVLFIMSGSIAISKCYEICKKLTTNNINIDCIVTDNAKKMINITKLKKNINGNVFTSMSEKNNKMLHIKLSRKSDLIILCPATANIIAKFANGFADDLASTTLIASNKQIIIIPAMNSEMWNNSINKKNISTLKKLGVDFIGPESGKLSCGEIGMGRLANLVKINEVIINNLNQTQIFKNKNCLITAGPTIEPIDNIRYLSNYSSGKQGYEIAKQMLLSGAKVTLVSGPTNIEPPFNVNLIKVNSAKEMLKAVKDNSKVDIAIFAAAVSDASPHKFSKKKIKKENFKNIFLKQNTDILYKISTLKNNRPDIVIGFAAETDNHILNAKDKLIKKKCDVIIVNKIDKNNKVFGLDVNRVSFVTKKKIIHIKKQSKENIAKKIVKLVSEFKR